MILIKVMINSEIIVQSMNFNGLENIALEYIKHKLLKVWIEIDRNTILVEDFSIFNSCKLKKTNLIRQEEHQAITNW